MSNDNSSFNHSRSPSTDLVTPEGANAGRARNAEANQNEQKLYLVSRNLAVKGHRTSVRLEPEMWNAYGEICRREALNVHQLADRIAAKIAPQQSLTSAIRVFIMAYFRASATEDGHAKAGHSTYRVGS